MRAALVLLFLSSGAARAQTVTDWHLTPAVLSADAPGVRCDVFAQHPGSGQVQVACYLGTALIYNAVSTVAATAVVCSVVSTTASLAWALVPATSPMIGYQLAAEVHNQGPPLFLGPVTSTPANPALAGTF